MIYPGTTLQLVTKYPGIDLSEYMISRFVSVKHGIQEYLDDEHFDAWLDIFTHTLARWPRHQQAVHISVGYNLPFQLNQSPPGWSAPLDFIRETIDQAVTIWDPDTQKVVDPNLENYEYNELLRHILGIAENLPQAANRPDIVLALALYQAAHRPYLAHLQQELHIADQHGRVSDMQHADSALGELSYQVKDFIIFKTYLPLVLLKLEDVGPPQPSSPYYQEVVAKAMAEAGEIFISKLFATNFGEAGTMVCPARPHLRHALKNGTFPKLHQFILENQDQRIIRLFLNEARRAIAIATFAPGCLYERFQNLDLGEMQIPQCTENNSLDLLVGEMVSRMDGYISLVNEYRR